MTLIVFICINMTAASGQVNAGVSSACEDKNYVSSFVPQYMPVAEKKLRFRCLVEPHIEAVYSNLTQQYLKVLESVNQNSDTEYLNQLRLKYWVDNNMDLLAAIKPHPRSITIAQAAIESAWGTSRFFREANNVFGIRPYRENDPKIAAAGKTAHKTIWLKKYTSIKAAIFDYHLVIARGKAFREFRKLKMKTADPHLLVKKLNHYSERKAGYAKELSAIIRYNNFHELD